MSNSIKLKSTIGLARVNRGRAGFISRLSLHLPQSSPSVIKRKKNQTGNKIVRCSRQLDCWEKKVTQNDLRELSEAIKPQKRQHGRHLILLFTLTITLRRKSEISSIEFLIHINSCSRLWLPEVAGAFWPLGISHTWWRRTVPGSQSWELRQKWNKWCLWWKTYRYCRHCWQTVKESTGSKLDNVGELWMKT